MTKQTIDTKDLNRLRNELEKHLQWGPGVDWHSSMFTEFSQHVFDKCNVMLSAATLKRFFGVVNHDGLPSIGTLDTLSQFLDYENWRAFKLSTPKKKPSLASGLSKRSIYVSAGFMIALVTVALIGSNFPGKSVSLENIVFSSRPVTNSYPNSVIFDFNFNGVESDNIHIQQYWDATKTIDIQQNQKQATGIYYFPGYFRAKLVVDDRVAKEHDLFLRSDSWLGTIEYEPVPKYFSPGRINNTGLTYPKEIESEIRNSDVPLIVVYHYINDLGEVSGDNFTLRTSIKNQFKEKWAVCQSAYIYVIGTTGAFIIPFSQLGCSSNNSLMLNDLFLNGKEHDLSAFATNLNDLTRIEITNIENHVSVSIEDSVVYENDYRVSMGKLVGIRFKFLGLGNVESFTLTDQFEHDVVLE